MTELREDILGFIAVVLFWARSALKWNLGILSQDNVSNIIFMR